MIISDLTELSIVNVFDRGVPNKERIVIRANETTEMDQYGLLLGIRGQGNSTIPLSDNFYWFGSGTIYPNQLIFVYTGPGEPVKSSLPGSETVTFSVHWGRKNTVLANREVVPAIVRMDAIAVANEQLQLPMKEP